MNLGELFDGEMHSLDPSADFQIPWEEVVEWVPVEVGARGRGRWESAEVRHVVRELTSPEQGWWGITNGWTSCNIMAQALARALGGESWSGELRTPVDDSDPFGAANSSYQFQFKPGRDGWQGGEPL